MLQVRIALTESILATLRMLSDGHCLTLPLMEAVGLHIYSSLSLHSMQSATAEPCDWAGACLSDLPGMTANQLAPLLEQLYVVLGLHQHSLREYCDAQMHADQTVSMADRGGHRPAGHASGPGGSCMHQPKHLAAHHSATERAGRHCQLVLYPRAVWDIALADQVKTEQAGTCPHVSSALQRLAAPH